MGMEVFLQKEPKIPGAHKIGTAISGPKVEGGQSTAIGFFGSEKGARTRLTTKRDRNLRFRGAVSSGHFIEIFTSFSVQLSKEIAPKRGDNCPVSGRRERPKNPVMSSGCHGCLGPEKGIFEVLF